MKYDVHLYVGARIKMEGVEANSQAEAVKKAERECEFRSHLDRNGVEWDETVLGALVDEAGDEEYTNTRYHALDHAPIYQDEQTQARIRLLPGVVEALRAILPIARETIAKDPILRNGEYKAVKKAEEFLMTVGELTNEAASIERHDRKEQRSEKDMFARLEYIVAAWDAEDTATLAAAIEQARPIVDGSKGIEQSRLNLHRERGG